MHSLMPTDNSPQCHTVSLGLLLHPCRLKSFEPFFRPGICRYKRIFSQNQIVDVVELLYLQNVEPCKFCNR